MLLTAACVFLASPLARVARGQAPAQSSDSGGSAVQIGQAKAPLAAFESLIDWIGREDVAFKSETYKGVPHTSLRMDVSRVMQISNEEEQVLRRVCTDTYYRVRENDKKFMQANDAVHLDHREDMAARRDELGRQDPKIYAEGVAELRRELGEEAFAKVDHWAFGTGIGQPAPVRTKGAASDAQAPDPQPLLVLASERVAHGQAPAQSSDSSGNAVQPGQTQAPLGAYAELIDTAGRDDVAFKSETYKGVPHTSVRINYSQVMRISKDEEQVLREICVAAFYVLRENDRQRMEIDDALHRSYDAELAAKRDALWTQRGGYYAEAIARMRQELGDETFAKVDHWVRGRWLLPEAGAKGAAQPARDADPGAGAPRERP